MTVALLAIGDGRYDYHAQSLASAIRHLPKFDEYVFVDDAEHKLGFDGAIRAGWAQITADYVFHLELDFVFDRDIPVREMAMVLQAHPYLAQLALLRGPVNEAEHAAGGVVEQHPESYVLVPWGERRWREHRRFFTTNPSVYPRWIVQRGWPTGPQSEGRFGVDLFAEDPARRVGFWDEGQWCHHIGHARGGTGY